MHTVISMYTYAGRVEAASRAELADPRIRYDSILELASELRRKRRRLPV